MKSYNVLGVDPSLTHTAAHHWSSSFLADGSLPFSIKSTPDQFDHSIARIDALAKAFEHELATAERLHGGPGLLVVEGYAFGAANQREALGEWGGQVRRIAYARGWRILVVPPTTLKKYVTGKGVCEKDGVRMEVLDRWAYKSIDNNDADAYALARLGLDYLAFERGDTISKSTVELFKFTAKQPKTDKRKAQKAKGLVVMEPANG